MVIWRRCYAPPLPAVVIADSVVAWRYARSATLPMPQNIVIQINGAIGVMAEGADTVTSRRRRQAAAITERFNNNINNVNYDERDIIHIIYQRHGDDTIEYWLEE